MIESVNVIKFGIFIKDQRNENSQVLETDRETWGNPIEFLMSCIAFSIGLGNVWRFPYTAYSNGGGAFVIIYLLVLFIVGKPVYYMEAIIGQFSSKSCVKMWALSPSLKGIGYGMTLVVFSAQSYQSGLMSLIVYYLIMSFRSTLPWSTCLPEWGEECFNSSSPLSSGVNSSKSSSELFFLKVVINESGIENGLGIPSWQLVSCLLFNWIVIFLILFKGMKTAGKASYFLAIFPYVVMLALFGRSVTLEGAIDGIIYFLRPDWNKMTDPQVWYAAVTQSFFSLGVCFGVVIMYASHNKFDHNITRDCMIISTLDLCTSLIAGSTIFGILGNLAFKLGTDDFNSIVRSGTGLAFISYPEALSQFSVVPSLFSVCFFLMLFVLAVGSSVACCSTVIGIVKDQFPRFSEWKIALGVCTLGFVIGIIYCTPGGQYMITLVDYYAVTFIIIVLATCEVIGISWIYGVDNFMDDVEFMTNKRPFVLWRICWVFLTPITLCTVFIYFMISLHPLSYNNEYYPTSAYVAGWTLVACGLLPMLVFLTTTIIHSEKKTFSHIFKPADNWGPRNAETRERWKDFKLLKQQKRALDSKKNIISRIFTALSEKFN
ncbi:sodium-dependent nutrient amino acid transporter 1-like isoform X2 [Microplitis mediator]|uniref:sodium-dependent nutrient amino acid transporter 1-like isoform X2 n=1 Tax=Microplitis mediator TaxID=375433 RepID=UPI002553EA0A|nr:sodium-dependent nutrient amino acid transporter 1-like isoform X2 [Microplitis mediator]